MQLPEALAKEDCAGPMDALCGGDLVSGVEGGSTPNDSAVNPKPADPAPAAPTSSTLADAPKAPGATPGLVLAAPVNGQGPANSDVAPVVAPVPSAEPVAPLVAAPPPPAPTAPPAPPQREAPILAATTIYRTFSDRVEEVVYVEQTETVFVTAAAPQKHRRHAHAHHRRMHKRDREHGLLGHKY